MVVVLCLSVGLSFFLSVRVCLSSCLPGCHRYKATTFKHLAPHSVSETENGISLSKTSTISGSDSHLSCSSLTKPLIVPSSA